MSGAPDAKTICFFSVATHLGGAERSLLDLVTRLKEQSRGAYEPWMLVPKSEGPLVDICRHNGIECSTVEMPEMFFKMSREKPLEALARAAVSAPFMGQYAFALRKALSGRKVHLMHTTGVKCHAIAGVYSSLTKVPSLWHLRDIFKTGPTLTALRALRATSRARVIANSRATANSFKQSDESIEVVYNGLDESRYYPKRNDRYRSVFNVAEDVPIVGIVGVLARWKGQLEFLEMARKATDQGVNARFVIIGAKIYDTTGDSDYEDLLRQRVKDLGLSERVHFAGYENESAIAMNGLDLLVHASTRPEPFGRVIVEGWSCGVPVIASRDGGVVELISHESTGLLFTPGSSDEMASCLARYASDQALRQSVAARARERFLERFTISSHVDQIISIYNQIAG